MATTTATKVYIVGPNLRDQSKGQFDVHADGCGHIARMRRRDPEYDNGWRVTARSRRDVVEAIYSDHMAEREREYEHFKANPDDAKRLGYTDEILAKGVDWHEFDDIHLAPCLRQLPKEA